MIEFLLNIGPMILLVLYVYQIGITAELKSLLKTKEMHVAWLQRELSIYKNETIVPVHKSDDRWTNIKIQKKK